ncbi:LysE/ArgO family amino acid transporter [Campylobacter sp. RM16188]|uniref:LysE/ArgO family amino acid transporter n=1 Tax=Campylobacter sp. RM16188 TaxID=1705725 RepID=UPI0020A6327C|nr:LysE family transporter [Campylobacter sp. RM16188]
MQDGYIVYQFRYLKYIARYGGAAFLLFYAIKSLSAAYTMNHALTPKELATPSLAKTALLTLAFTWLNPHVYLDTVILIRSS